jgi:hypothetical protein
MRQVVWKAWEERDGIRADDRSTWPLETDWRVLREAKFHPAFRAVLGSRLVELADALLDTDWTAPHGFGNLLASLPDADIWHMPGRGAHWHCDYGFERRMDPLPALRVFAIFGDVACQGGGTLLVAGSHRMVELFVRDRPELAMAQAKRARPACHRSRCRLGLLVDSRPLLI